ncbi:Protein MMS22-like [Camelus dromedarius]|uniref:Protein MMS22-like n=1 Tax=Camelus dromedarius TaxID=9838 RepID=A0A5N4DXD6_CAMDR|nr:Protein MMS22-like [Camelus dromedarius]
MYIKNLYVPDDSFTDVNPEQAVDKEYVKQLAELTRLLFKLSEVKNIFSKAQVEYLPIPEDPKKALVQFLEAVGITYGNLQTLSDKSAMVTKSLEYLGEILKYIKPYLGKKISSAGLQLTYWMMGHVYRVLKSYFEFKGSLLPPRLASILAFILQLVKETNIDVSEIELLLPGVLKCLMLVSEPQVKKLATENLQYMVKACQVGSGGEPATQLTSVFRQFIQDYGMRYDYQIYSILEIVVALDQQVVIHLISTLTQSLKNSERKWGLGRNIAQREAYSKLLSHLGQVGQDEIQRLENDNAESIL